MLKKIILCFLAIFTVSEPYTHKKSFFNQLITQRPLEQDILLHVTDDVSINISQTIHIALAAYLSLGVALEIKYCIHIDTLSDNIQEDLLKWIFFSFMLITHLYKMGNAEHIMPFILHD